MKKNLVCETDLVYNINNSSYFMDGVGLGGSVGQGLEVLAMDRLDRKVSRRKQVQDVGAGQGLVPSPFCGISTGSAERLAQRPPLFFSEVSYE